MKIAIIGASKDKFKYWNKILCDIHRKWHEVYPVNPKEDEIEWIKCFNDVLDLPEDIEIFNFVTPPDATLKILENMPKNMKEKIIWCQPWASNDKVIEHLDCMKCKYLVDSCIMIRDINM